MENLSMTTSGGNISLASTSTSHGSTNNYVYQVFINHRGPDTKKGLASHLYCRLNAHGLRAFLDNVEMQPGDNLTPQIQGAIRTVSVHVAIFSPRYAESTWCLDELVQMLESGSTIIPVFYGVNPSDLRWTRGGDGLYTRVLSILEHILGGDGAWRSILHCILCTRGENGVYARALRMLEKKTTFDPRTNKKKPRYESTTIQKWRDALSDVSQISGFELNACDGDEGQLIDKVVEQVLKKISVTPLSVAKYPTGLDKKVKDFETKVLSHEQSGKARVVGIVGFGGVGKTTLAKELFNRHRSNYDRCCFLSDVREKAIDSLQSKLLKDLTQSIVNSTDEGIEMFKKYLSSSHRAFIVLDDVDHIDQLDALFSPVKDSIHSSSLILVTSRNKDILISSGIVELFIYKQTGLNRQHSQELFCSHAFNQPYPVKEFKIMVEMFLDVCDGLPLSLKVIGALLFGKDLKYWKAQFKKIHKTLPSDIVSSLKISYDSLDSDEKQIFLDVACFFIGESKETAIRIWKGSEWDEEGWLGLRDLENKCLVEVKDYRIRMHDHLRDLGRDMAEKECPRRLWRLTDNFLHNVSGQSSVRGINMLHGNGPEQSFKNLADSRLLTNMSKLELLRAEGDIVESVFSAVQLPQLIWLRWEKCPYASLPSLLPVKNLRVLYIQGRDLKTLWEHESQAPLQLRELNIDAPLLKVPRSIGKLKKLERFVVHKADFETLPDEFCHLHSLKNLELKRCGKMTSLPPSVGNLTNLQILFLGACSALQKLPDSVGNLTKLQSLHLAGCSSLQILPDSVGSLTNLQNIHLGACSALQKLPDSVRNFINLQSLHLGSCSALEMLPDSVGNFTNLQILSLDGCSALKNLPDSIGNFTSLQALDLRRCSALQRLPHSFENLTSLQSLYLDACSALPMLPHSFGNLTNLQSLHLAECSALQMLPDSLGSLTNLQSLYLRSCSALQMLPDSVGNFRNLQILHLGGCSSLQNLPDSIGNLTSLQVLHLSKCSGLQMLPHSFENLTNVKSLYLGNCSALPVLLDSVVSLTNLQSLHLAECIDLQMLPDSVESLTNLQSLHLGSCTALQMLPDSFGKFTNLQSLHLVSCAALQNLPDSIGNFTNLQILHLGGCSALQNLPDSIGNLTNLSSLDLRGCLALTMLPDSVGNLRNLPSLDLRGCSALQRLPNSVENLTNLRSLVLRGCSALQILPDSMGNLTNLAHLVLRGCSALRMLPDSIGNLSNLPSLDLSGCFTLRFLPNSVGKLRNLSTLNLGGCSALQMLPESVGNLTNLQSIHLRRCYNLQRLPSVEKLILLEKLDVFGCRNLQWGAGQVEQLRQRLKEGFSE